MNGKNPDRAKFTPVQPAGPAIDVHFNPVSLQYSVSNTLKEEGKGKTKKQFITQSTAKLTLDLIFDNTGDGKDVRLTTQKIAAFMDPEQQQGKDVAKVVRFEWGSYKFQGMIEGFKETLDFFSPEGVPLRSAVNLTLAQQDKTFVKDDKSSSKPPDAVDVPSGPNTNATQTASQAGSSDAGRAVAALNGMESMRFASGPLTVTGSVQLGGPVAFASGGAGIGIGGSIGGGISGGIGVGGGIGAGLDIGGGIGGSIGAGIGVSGSIGASLDIGGGIGAGIGVSGGASFSAGASASAGVSASDGAFAGLRVSTDAPSSFRLDTSAFAAPAESLTLSASADASFRVGGITTEGSAGLQADVGINADLRARIQFDGV